MHCNAPAAENEFDSGVGDVGSEGGHRLPACFLDVNCASKFHAISYFSGKFAQHLYCFVISAGNFIFWSIG